MKAAVQSALDLILGGSPFLKDAKGAGRIFELYIMTGIAAEMLTRGFVVWLQRSDGKQIYPGDPDQRFIQRGGAPTGINPKSDGPGYASVIGLKMQNGTSWELWNGVQFTGRSGAYHEIDIGLVPASVGDALRLTGGCPFGRPRVAIECKDVSTSGSLDETRAFVARLYDLTILESHRKHLQLAEPVMAIYPGSPIGTRYEAQYSYRDENQTSFNAIARQGAFSSGTKRITKYYEIERHPSITLNSAEYSSLIQAACDWIATRLP